MARSGRLNLDAVIHFQNVLNVCVQIRLNTAGPRHSASRRPNKFSLTFWFTSSIVVHAMEEEKLLFKGTLLYVDNKTMEHLNALAELILRYVTSCKNTAQSKLYHWYIGRLHRYLLRTTQGKKCRNSTCLSVFKEVCSQRRQMTSSDIRIHESCGSTGRRWKVLRMCCYTLNSNGERKLILKYGIHIYHTVHSLLSSLPMHTVA